MSTLSSLVWLAACSGGPPELTVPATAPLPFDQTGATPVVQLDRHPGEFTLPDGVRPAGTDIPHSFVLTDLTESPGWSEAGLVRLSATLPFRAGGRQAARFAPEGLVVSVDGQEIPHATRPSRIRTDDHYSFARGGELVLVLRHAPQGDVIVAHDGLREHITRLEPGSSGLEPADYIRYTYSIEDRTREGLLLPAGASLKWQVDLPDKARFEAFSAMVDSRLRDVQSDGAGVKLRIHHAGNSNVVNTHVVRAKPSVLDDFTSGDGGFVRWAADLSKYGGQTVTFELEVSPAGSPDFDWVFLGSPVIAGQPTAPPRRVVVIGLDTTRADHLSLYGYDRDTTPELDAWAKRASVFDAAWAPAPRTRPSFRTATTGRNPLDAVNARNLGAVLDEQGFATAGIVANVHLNPRFGFTTGFDDWQLDAEAKADDQVDRALAWLGANKHRDTFLFLHLMDPHLLYIAPEPYNSRFVSSPDPELPEQFNRWHVEQWSSQGELSNRRKDHIKALYDGELAWTSAQMQRFFDGLGKLGGNDLVVVHSDHGEELFDHGRFEHNHALFEELVRAALIIKPPPGQPATARIDEPVWLADIAPTVLDYVGVSQPPPTDGRSLRPAIEGKGSGPARPLPIGHLMYDREQWGVITDGHKYLLHTESGVEELYDLAADPQEKHNLAAGSPDLTNYWTALGKAHGMPVGPGWRIDVTLATPTVQIELPTAAIAAGVIDPEATRTLRSNLAWGEPPDKLPEEVATVTLSDDRRLLTISKGTNGRGTLWVQFDAPTAPMARLIDGSGTLLGEVRPGRTRWSGLGNSLGFRTGIVFDPPKGEAARMGILWEARTDEQTCELCTLGYLSGAACSICGAD